MTGLAAGIVVVAALSGSVRAAPRPGSSRAAASATASGMSQYGAYGLARHGRGYRSILAHYYRHTHVGKASRPPGPGAARLGRRVGRLHAGTQGVRQAPSPQPRATASKRSGSRRRPCASSRGRKIARCGRAATAVRRARSRSAARAPTAGSSASRRPAGASSSSTSSASTTTRWASSPTRCPRRGPRPRCERRRWRRAPSRSRSARGGIVRRLRRHAQPGLRRQGHRDPSTNRAVRATEHQIVRYHGQVATTYYFSTSGGRTEALQFAFPGAEPGPVPEERQGPLRPDLPGPLVEGALLAGRDGVPALRACSPGRLRKIKVLKRGDSPRIVRAQAWSVRAAARRRRARTLQARLGLKSTWARFHRQLSSWLAQPSG